MRTVSLLIFILLLPSVAVAGPGPKVGTTTDGGVQTNKSSFLTTFVLAASETTKSGVKPERESAATTNRNSGGLHRFFGNVALLLLAILAVAWPIVSYLDKFWLLDDQKRRMKERFERWWLSVAELDRTKFALAIASAISNSLDAYFGSRLFSRQAWSRSIRISTGVLVASLSLLGLLNGTIIGIAPWATYHNTMTWLTNSDEVKKAFIFTSKENEKTFDQERKKLLQYDTIGCRAAFSVVFFLAMFTLNGLLFFLSLIFGRFILREMVAAGRTFTTISLFITNLVIVGIISSLGLLLLTCFTFPVLWLVPILLYGLLTLSIQLFMVVLGVGNLVALAFAPAELKVVVWIAFSPCFLTLAVVVFTGAFLASRRWLHTFVTAVLIRCVEKGPIPFVMGSLTLLTVLIGILSRISSLADLVKACWGQSRF